MGSNWSASSVWVGGVDHQVDAIDVDGPEHGMFGGVTRIGDDVAQVHVDVAVFYRIARTQRGVPGLVAPRGRWLRSGSPASSPDRDLGHGRLGKWRVDWCLRYAGRGGRYEMCSGFADGRSRRLRLL